MLMTQTATTVGGYLQGLPADRRVAMARVCSMIRRSARGVRESMRYGLAFYEMDGPVFAVESTSESLNFYFIEPEAALNVAGADRFLDKARRRLVFQDPACIPLDKVEAVVRNTLKIRRLNQSGCLPGLAEVLAAWSLTEDAAAEAPTIVKINSTPME